MQTLGFLCFCIKHHGIKICDFEMYLKYFLFLLLLGHSSVYYWPGYYSFDEKPTYHNQEIRYLGANITESQKHIAETFDVYEKDPSLNFMVLYVDAPDTTGHVHGVTSKEVIARLSIDRLSSLSIYTFDDGGVTA